MQLLQGGNSHGSQKRFRRAPAKEFNGLFAAGRVPGLGD
jgi:hypothetical protein